MRPKYKAKTPLLLVMRHKPNLQVFASLINQLLSKRLMVGQWRDWKGNLWEIHIKERAEHLNQRVQNIPQKYQRIAEKPDYNYQYGALSDEDLKRING